MSAGPHFYSGDTLEVRAEIADRILQAGSMVSLAKLAPCSFSALSKVMRCQMQPGPRLLDWLNFDREIIVRYVRR